MVKVTGIGGIFFKAKDPKGLLDFYAKHLGIAASDASPWGEDDSAPLFVWRDLDNPDTVCYTVFGVFDEDTDYLKHSTSPYMFNFRVDDLDAALNDLRAAGVEVDEQVEAYSYGRFGWFYDPEGTRVELWEPAEGF